MKTKRKLAINGNCYQAAASMVLDSPDASLILAHGVCTGQGPLAGMDIGHAWVESGDFVLDRSNGQKLCLSAVAYYAIGNARNVHRYSKDQIRELICKTRHWGPWYPGSEKTHKKLLTFINRLDKRKAAK